MILDAERPILLVGLLAALVLLVPLLWYLDSQSSQLEKRVETFTSLRREYLKLQKQLESQRQSENHSVKDPLSYIEEKTTGYPVDEISPVTAGQDRRRFRLVLRSVSISAPFSLFKTFSEEHVMTVRNFRLDRVERDLKEFDVFFVLEQ